MNKKTILKLFFKEKKETSNILSKLAGTFVLSVLFAGMTSLYASTAYSQDKVSLNVENISIEELFKEIQNTSNFVFFYNDNVLKSLKKVALNVTNEKLNNVLDKAFKGTNYVYKIIDNQVLVDENVKQLDERSKKLQQQQITGKVTGSSGLPLPGVNVIVEGFARGTTTDFDGNYAISVNKGQTLVFSFVGTNTQKVVVGDNNVINIVLQDNVEELESVVITGYQNIERALFTGASQSIKAEEIKLDGVPEVSRLLEGRAAGVSVQNVTGTFGASPRITIRGSSSILGDTKPIWVVDGAIQEGIVDLNVNDLVSGDTNTLLSSAISGLNANDIESIDILKDASATALYGARALNGVIVITTKSGKRNQATQVNYSAEFAVRPIPNYDNFNLLNSQETVSIYREMESKGFLRLAGSLQNRFGGIYNIMYRSINEFDPSTNSFKLANTPEAKAQFLRQYELANTDWFKVLFNPAPTQTHSLSFSGGSETSTQYASISYYTDGGWTIADRVRRLTANIRNSYYIGDDWKATAQVNASYRDQNAPGAFSRETDVVTGGFNRDFDINPYSYALNTSRALRPYDNDGELEYFRYNWAPFNILNELANNRSEIDVLDVKFQGELEYKINEDLTYNFLGTARYAKSTTEHSVTEDSNVSGAYRADETAIVRQQNTFLFQDTPNSLPRSVLPFGGILTRTDNNLVTYNFRNTLDYNKEFNDLHRLRVYGGQEFRYLDRKETFNRGYGFQFGKGGVPFIDPDIITKQVLDGNDYFGLEESRERGVTFFAQATYAYDERYVFNITGNYEGSNRAGTDASTRWLPTYNFGGKWNIHKESFMDNVDWINELAFRPSYGLVALLADNVSNNLAVFRNQITDRLDPAYRENFINIDDLQNTELTWEKTRELNLGLDLGLFNNRVSLVFDVYFKRGEDLIDVVRTSGVGGEQFKLANNAEMSTDGFEVQLTTRNFSSEDFKWTTTVNFSYFDQEITSLQQRPNVFDLVTLTGGNVVGFPRGSLFSYNFQGLDDRGLPTFDLGEEGEINFQDATDILDYLVYEGSTEPNYTGGMANNFTYKNWDLGFFITFQAGNKIRLDPAYSAVYSDLSVFPKEFTNRWISPGDENVTNVPVIASRRLINTIGTTNSAELYNAYNYSTERIVDGSFVRMKNISLAYSFNQDILQRFNLKSLRLSAQATNPFLIYSDSDLRGQDPEFFRTGGVANPISSQYSLSLNIGL